MQKHKSYNFTLPTGQDQLREVISLDRGNVIGGFIKVANPNGLGAGFTNIGINRSNGTTLEEVVCREAWEQRQGGNYLDSIKPLSFNEDKIQVIIGADNATTANVNFQMVLVYEQEFCD